MPLAATASSPPAPRKPWALPPAGLAVFYGRPETPRLFHYFLPRLLAEGKQVLCLDGANRFDPLLIARLARQRGIAAAEFNRRIRVARAFTCFQLTELLVRVPRFLEKFAADALIVTALPDLYFDEDVRDREAAVAFGAALDALRALRPLPLGIGVFSDATSFQGPRHWGRSPTFGLHFSQTRKHLTQRTQRTQRTRRKAARITDHEPRITDAMGRTVPTFRQLIDDAIARWSKFRRALRREDQEYFDRLFRRVRTYTQAATYQASDNPMEAILLSIALDQEKRLDALEHAALPPGEIPEQLDAPEPLLLREQSRNAENPEVEVKDDTTE